MTDRFLVYRIKKELPFTLLFMAILMGIWAVCRFFLKREEFSMVFDVMIFNMVLLAYKPSDMFGQYMSLGYSRKKFYKSQIVMTLIHSMIFAAFRTIIQYAFYDEYVKMFMEDTDHTADMYHRVSIPELFVTNVLVFLVFLMIGVLSVAIGIKGMNMAQKADVTLQLKYRMSNRNNKYKGTLGKVVKMFIKPLGFICALALLVVIELSAVMYYWFQMIYEPVYRIGIMTGIFIVFGIMYLVGKCLYKPKFV